jgi:anhydro-N-acetylmuramic acid kinase
MLFHEYEACLNIGGFANISFRHHEQRIAFDICAANIVLNLLCHKIGLAFDQDGNIAACHSINTALLNQLNEIDFFKKEYPKSLGFEFVEQAILPILFEGKYDEQTLIATFTKHIADTVLSDLKRYNISSVLITGGGAYNSHLIRLLKQEKNIAFHLPSKDIIEFKEAICFAFLGLLRYHQLPNTLASVTGAKANSVGACIYSGL